MLGRKRLRDIAKVGVEGSNPFARSKFSLSGPDTWVNFGPNSPSSQWRRLSAVPLAEVDKLEAVDRSVPRRLSALQ